jgi:hypothetical protein
MQVGDYIRIKGREPNWVDRKNGLTHPGFSALVIELKPQDNMFHCLVMKADGTLWNVYEKQIEV